MMVTVLEPKTTQHADLEPKTKLEHVLMDQQMCVQMQIQHKPFHVLYLIVLWRKYWVTGQMMVTVLQPETTQHAGLVPKIKLEHALMDQQMCVQLQIQHKPLHVRYLTALWRKH